MGIWSSLFNSSDTLSNVTDAVINTGDKLVYTAEERAEMNQKVREFFPTILNAYEPFKIAQRILAIWFSFLFGLAFIIGLIMLMLNMIYDATFELKLIYDLVEAFSLDYIIIAIVSFYFLGGTIESWKRTVKK